MSYISQSTNNSPWNYAFPARHRNNVWILIIGKKNKNSPTSLVAISSQKLTGKCNKVHEVTACRNKEIIRKFNIQEDRCIFNQIRHRKENGNKLTILPTKPPTQYHIGDIINRSLRYEWYESCFSNDEKI